MTGIYRKGQMGSSGSFGGSGSSQDINVDETFSLDRYIGTGNSIQITNGVNLSSDDGLVLIKSQSDLNLNWTFFDTIRGNTKLLQCPDHNSGSNSPAEVTGTATRYIQSFNNNGYTIGTNSSGSTSDGPGWNKLNASPSYGYEGYSFIAHTFKKEPKFFDIVTYTGNGSNQAIAHSLDCEVGMIWVKRRDSASDWVVFHRRQNSTNSHLGYVRLNHTTQYQTASSVWNDTAPTTTHFTVGNSADVNANNGTFVAYIFAHDTEANSIIKNGVFTTNSSGDSSQVDLGFEPQFIIAKPVNNTGTGNNYGGWLVLDTLRGLNNSDQMNNLWLNHESPQTQNYYIKLNQSGFIVDNWEANKSYIYTAIGRGGMSELPTSRSSVFDANYVTNGNGTGWTLVSATKPAFTFDVLLNKISTSGNEWNISNRLIGYNRVIETDMSQQLVEHANTGMLDFGDRNAGYRAGGNGGNLFGSAKPVTYFWKRSKGFCDVVSYDGTGSNRTIQHNLGRQPEMIWIKNRDSSEDWAVYYGDATDYLRLNTDGGTVDDSTYWNDTSPTSTVFTVGTNDDVNHSSESHIAYLFGSVTGISRIGTFSHTNGSSTNVDCGFSSGSIFVVVKRTDASGSWYVWDSERGIVSGNDPYLVLDNKVAEVTNTDFIDPLNSGFQMASSFSTGSYFFYAIAT